MNKGSLCSIAFLIFAVQFNASIAATDPAADAPPELVQLVNNTFICRFSGHILPDSVPSFVSDIAQQAGVGVRYTYTTAFKGFSAHMSATAAEALKENNTHIEYCVKNELIRLGGAPVDAGKGQGKGGNTEPPVPQFVPPGITRVGGPIDGRGLTAWIIDSGIDLDNADLNVDASRGKDVVKLKGKGTVDDVYGHGTHVAGTLAAIDNDINVVGVAAGATVIPVRILKASDYGTIDAAIAGIDFVAANAVPGEIANMSAWWWKHHPAFHEAAYNLAERIPFIVISGNDGADLNAAPAEPAHVEHPNLYTVSAVDHSDVFGDFSNWGFADDWASCDEEYPEEPFECVTVDFAAPGVDVASLQPGGGLATWWGTSMAAPHVSGIILLLQNSHRKPGADGTAINDPDSQDDPIIHH